MSNIAFFITMQWEWFGWRLADFWQVDNGEGVDNVKDYLLKLLFMETTLSDPKSVMSIDMEMSYGRRGLLETWISNSYRSRSRFLLKDP